VAALSIPMPAKEAPAGNRRRVLYTAKLTQCPTPRNLATFGVMLNPPRRPFCAPDVFTARTKHLCHIRRP
jgi:hypothetical protein